MFINNFNISPENFDDTINELNCFDNNNQINNKLDTILDGIIFGINKKDELS